VQLMNILVRSIALILMSLASISGADDPLSTADVMASLEESDWRRPDPGNLLYMQLASGTVIMELAPKFAPQSILNIKTLAKEKYFDDLAIIRSQDNYVVQWADPAEEEETAKSLGSAKATLTAEFERSLDGDGFPAGSDGTKAWLAHCYGMVGVARGNETDSGNGTSLYVITGHAPRHLDRNVALVGRVISGIEHLTVLPRGAGEMGFYESLDAATPIVSIRLGVDVAEEDQAKIELMRTDTEAFADYVMSRAFRHEEWFVEPTGRIEICNINPPTRVTD